MPFGTKRRGSGNVAGRYLAAIGGTCGDLEDATLSPVGKCVSADQGNSNSTKSNPLAIRAQHYDQAITPPAAPKTPTKREHRKSSFLSSSPPSFPFATSPTHQKMQLSPSGATATTLDFSQSWATASSPTSRKSRGTPSRSPVHYNNPNEKKPANFFSIFPSTKIAIRAANPSYQKQRDSSSSMKEVPAQTVPPPPPPRRDFKEGSSSTPAWEEPNQPQHLIPACADPNIELVLGGHQQQSSSSTAAPSKVKQPSRKANMLLRSSATFGKSKFARRNDPLPKEETASSVSEGAPTEVTTNRTFDRRFVMDPSDLWRKKKAPGHVSSSHPRKPAANSQDTGEEKKQDSDVESPLTEHSKHHQRYHDTPPPATEEAPTRTDEDLLLYGPVPLERTNTRRTSNRGKFNNTQPNSNVYGQHGKPFQTQSAAHHHQRRSPQPQHPSPQPQCSPKPSPHYHMSSPPNPRSSPRLNRHLSKSEKPIDTKSLLSVSTNESSSGMSPASLLNPILDQAQEKQNESRGISHWWSADKVKLTPRSSPVHGRDQAGSPRKKAVVAYPDSPPSYPKQQKSQPKPSSPQNNDKSEEKKDESFESHKSDLGVIGLEDEEEHEETYGPMQKTIPKLAPCKQDPQKKKPLTKQPQPSQIQPPRVQLKPRKNRASAELIVDADPSMSIVSESSVWTPLAISEAGLDFSQEKLAPLLPLFSQDQFEFFGPDESFPKHEISNQISRAASRLEKRVGSIGHKGLDSQPHDNGPYQQQPEQKQQLETDEVLKGKEIKPIAPPPPPPKAAEGSRPCPSPEIWRRTEGETTDMSSPDPIFCTQPSVSQPPLSTMASSVDFGASTFSQSDTQPPAKTQGDPVHTTSQKAQPLTTETEATASLLIHSVDNKQIEEANASKKARTSVSPSQNVGGQAAARKWPRVKTNFDTPAGPEVNMTKKLDPPTAKVDYCRSQGIPRRSISGPVVPMSRSVGRVEKPLPAEKDANDASSRQVETGVDTDQEKSVCSTGSLPRRSKSEQVGRKSKKNSPLRGSFQAAFAAFEKSSAGQYNEAYFPNLAAAASEDQASIEQSNSFATSRLAMVLNTHLQIQASESLEVPTAKADAMSVDIQSIRSNFEGVAPVDSDDDNASVKSLREVFETTATDQQETAVSRMRSLFENKKPPTPNNFETSSAEVREVWNSFESRIPPPRRPSSAMKVTDPNQHTRPSCVPNQNARGTNQHLRPLSVPSVSDSKSKCSTPVSTVSVANAARRFQGANEPASEAAQRPGDGQNSAEHTRPKTVAANQGDQEGHQHDGLTKQRTPPSPSNVKASAGRWQPSQEKKYAVVTQVQKGFGMHGSWSKPKENRSPQGVRSNLGAEACKGSALQAHPPPPPPPPPLCHPEPPELDNQRVINVPASFGTSEQSSGESIPSDRIVVSPATDIGDTQSAKSPQVPATIREAPPGVSASPDAIVSPPRLGIQTDPSDDGRMRKDYLPKDFSPTPRMSKVHAHVQGQGPYAMDKDTLSASEGEFSDGVTLDLSVAEVSQLTNPTAIESKAGDDSTIGDISAGEKTVEIDLMDCEAKRSTASSSQQTEAAAPLIARALKRLSDDLSLESRNQIAKMWEKSTLLGELPTVETKTEEKLDSSGWDLSNVQASFPLDAFPSSGAFFGFEEESGQGWQPFDKGDLWPVDPFSANQTTKDQTKSQVRSSGPSRDPDGFHIDGKLNTSTHITKPTNRQRNEDDSRSAPSDEVDSKLGAKSSPPRTYDTRSHVYTQAKQHAKAMLAARSPSRQKKTVERKPETPTRTRGGQSPQRGYPSPRSRSNTSTSSPSTTPTSSVAPNSNPAARVSILRSSPTRADTSPSRSPPSRSPTSTELFPIFPRSSPTRPVTPPNRSPASSQPVTPNQRAVTPTINNLRYDCGDSHSTPKVSHRRRDVRSVLPTPSKHLLESYPDPWMPQNGFAPPSQQVRESEQQEDDDSFPAIPSGRVDFFSTDAFSIPVFESKDVVMPPPSGEKPFPHTPKRIQPEFRGSPSSVRDSGVFSRTHPSSSDTIRQRKHNAAATIQSFRTSPPRTRPDFVVPQQPTSGQSSPRSPGGRLASVVGKHAALMARLRVLKAARMRRSAPTSPNRSDSGGVAAESPRRPKSSIGRAIASVYKSRRNHSSTGYVQTKYGAELNEVEPKPKEERKPTPAAPPQASSAFDPFLNSTDFPDPSLDGFDFDEFSDSAGDSSTRFGGSSFALALELD